MKKLILLILFSTPGFTKDLHCFKGKINHDLIDQVCFNLNQVESVTKSSSPGMIEVKILNIPKALILYSSLESFKKKLK